MSVAPNPWLESELVKLSILRPSVRAAPDFVKLCPICLSYRSRSARWSFYVTVLPRITTQSRTRPAIFRRLKSALAERVIRLLYAETVTAAAGDCSFFFLLVSNFDTFSRAQFFALAREGCTSARIGFSGSEVQSACRDSSSRARASANATGLSAVYFFIIVVVYRAI